MAQSGPWDDEGSLSLRTQLLVGLGILLWAALLGVGVTMVVWRPSSSLPPLAVAGTLAGLALAEVSVLVLFADYLLRRNFVEPLQEMVEDAEEIAAGDHGHRLDVESPAELRRLSVAVNEMAERLIEHQWELEENIRSLDETNRALTEARDELIHAEKLASVGRLAAGLAHEIGNPLNAVTTYVEIGRRRTEGEVEWLEGIAEEADRIDAIVTGLLDYARPREAPVVEVRVNEVVADTLDLLEGQGRLEAVDVELNLQEDLPPVAANPVHLQQVLVNLVMNACDAVESVGGRAMEVRTRSERYRGPEGSRYRARREDDPEEVDYSHIRRFNERPRETPRPGFQEGDGLVVLEVVDEGPGLPTDDPQQVFDPFFTTKDPGKGTGLGLSVSARLVDEMSGDIRARDRDGAGCVFRVRLPVDRPPAAGDGGEADRERADRIEDEEAVIEEKS